MRASYPRLASRAGVIVLGVAAMLAASAPASAQGQGGARPPTPVTVVTVARQDVPLTATLPGRVVASAIAEVRPQVQGIVVERLFSEGTEVAVGDPLFRIDPASYQARVASAEANLTQTEARFRAADREAARMQTLIDRKIVSEQSTDEALATRDMAEAEVAVAKANLLAAEIDLERTTIRAPLSGVIGRSLATQGALVTDGQSQPLAVIRKIDPVLVDVTQSAAELVAWRRGMTADGGARPDAGAETVSLTLADGGSFDHTGLLTAAEPYVNEQTGVVTLRMEFPNPDRILLPGMYVQVAMPKGVAKGVVLAPQEGVTRDRRGRPVAMVVNAEGMVEERPLEVIEARDGDWIVRSGLEDGDRIIVEGLQKIQPGAPVAPEERDTASAAVATD